MDTMIFTFVALLFVVVAMSVGVLMGGKPIAGSCGGMANLGMDTACDICGGDPKKCDEEQERLENEGTSLDLSYEVKSKE